MRRITKQPEGPQGVVDAVLFADTHFQPVAPSCRQDIDWVKTQITKLDFVFGLGFRYGCPLIHAGDFWDKWNTSLWFVNKILEFLKISWPGVKLVGIPGQHDLPQHRQDRLLYSAWKTLVLSGVLLSLISEDEDVSAEGVYFYHGPSACPIRVKGTPWDAKMTDSVSLEGSRRDLNGRRVVVGHKLVRNQPEPLFKGDVSVAARSILKAMPGVDLVVTGDNHQSFTYATGGQLLVNPGSLMRRATDQADHEPSVYLWHAETNTVDRVYVPIVPEAVLVDKEKQAKEKQREKRISAFVERLVDGAFEVQAHFQTNLEAAMALEKTPKAVQDLVWELVEGK